MTNRRSFLTAMGAVCASAAAQSQTTARRAALSAGSPASQLFWTVETTELINILSYGGRDMLSYPLTIYHRLMQRFFLFVVPLAFGSFVPACYLLGKSLPFGLPGEVVFAAPLLALAFAMVSRVVWHFGVRHYQSTGS